MAYLCYRHSKYTIRPRCPSRILFRGAWRLNGVAPGMRRPPLEAQCYNVGEVGAIGKNAQA